MVRVALIDDDPIYTAQVQEYLARFEAAVGEKISVSCFTDGDEIALDYKAQYDIILMDIEMRFMDGMTAAEEIRHRDSEVVILFITNSPQYAIRGYAVDAMDYVLKPISYRDFAQRLERAMGRMRRRKRKYLRVDGKDGSIKLDQSRIHFVEVQGHALIYHTADGLINAAGSMREVEQALGSRQFFRCNKGYLVNLEQVDSIQGDDAMVGGEAVPISRPKKKAFLDALNDYINEVGK